MSLDADQKERYSRHLSLELIGAEGQERLLDSRVLVVGCGGLGSPVAMYLATAGVGSITLMDGDDVELSNLQRQLLHGTADLGVPKTRSAQQTLLDLNPGLSVTPLPERLTSVNSDVVASYDVVVDAVDNAASKLLIATACMTHGIRYVHGGISEFTGQTLAVIPGETACLGCLFGDLPSEIPSVPRGPIGVLPGVIGSIQATETIKLLLGIGSPLTDCILLYDALEMTFRRVPVMRQPGCLICGSHD